MKLLVILGIVLLVVGIFSIGYEFSYKREHHSVGIGPLSVEVHEEKTVPMPLIIGGIAIVLGVVLIVLRNRKFSS